MRLPQQIAAFVLSAFGALALGLAVGLCGVVSHGVARRTRAIGIRMALGATWAPTPGASSTGWLRAD